MSVSVDNLGDVYALEFAPDGTALDAGYTTYTDSNGNQIGATTDSVGRALLTITTESNTLTYTVANAKGDNTSQYIAKFGTINVNTNSSVTGLPQYSAVLNAMTELDLPDGTKYTFGYDSGSTGTHLGRLTSMTLPTGGQITYSWSLHTDSQGNKYSWISTRTTPDSSTAWTYTPAVVSTCSAGQINCAQTFTVTKPSGDNIVYTSVLNGGAWTSEADYYSGSVSPSNLVAKTSQCWNFVTITNGTCTYTVTTGSPSTNILKLAASTTLPTPGGSSVSKTTQYTYDGYGNTTKIQENKYYTGTLPATVDRTTSISYLNSTNYINALILNRPLSVTITNSSGGTIAQTNYCYDYAGGCGGSSFVSATGVINHNDSYYGVSNTIRGDGTQVQRLISGTTNVLTTSMTYDMTGQVRTSTDSKGNVTTYSYTNNFFDDNGSNPPAVHSATAANAYPTTITPAISGLASTFGYYFGTGQVAVITDPNGNSTYWHFADYFSRPTSTALPNGEWTLNLYDLTGIIESGAESYVGITSASGVGCSSCRHNKAVFDVAGLGRVAKQYLVNDPDGQTEVDTTYDSNGRVATVSNPYRSTSDSTYGLETPNYDGLDRSWKITHADSNVAYTYYGAQITSALGQTTQQCSTSTYGLGYPVLAVDEAGNKRETWTDGFGRVIETDEPNSSGSLSVYTCYNYDLNNNLTQVTSSATSPNQTRTYTYDMLSRITSKAEPETGTTCFYYTTSGGTCGAPASGTLCSGDPTAVCRRTDARSITTTYTYDAVNRLTGKSYSDSTSAVSYSYDQTTYNGLMITNGKGRRTGMSDGSGLTAWSYDSVGNVLTEQRTINSKTETISYTYNFDGSIATITYPGGRTVTYATGNAQRSTSAADTTNSINYAKTATYAPPGELGNVVYGYASGGFAGITENRTYNNRLEITAIQATSSAGTPLSLAYSYVTGNNGNIATQTNAVSTGRSQNYAYDSLNRLLTAQTVSSSGGDCWGQAFGNNATPPTLATDALSNLFYTSSNQCSSPAPQYTLNTNNSNQFAGTGISYNSDGDMTADTAFSYTYDAENRVTTASGMTNGPYCYIYDGNGLRVMKAHASGGSCTGTVTVDMLYWRNIAGQTIAESDGTGSTSNSNYNEYIFFAGRRVAQSNPASGSLYYYFVDHLGSTRVVTNSTGTACYEVDFLPYGNENTPAGFTNTCSTRYRFTGYERDLETAYGTSAGNDYAFARYYNTRLGRFMSGDPLSGKAGDPQTLNKYAYVRNNPMGMIDPTGMDGQCSFDPNQYCLGNDSPLDPGNSGGDGIIITGGNSPDPWMTGGAVTYINGAAGCAGSSIGVDGGPCVPSHGTHPMPLPSKMPVPASMPPPEDADDARIRAIFGQVYQNTQNLTHPAFYAEFYGASAVGGIAIQVTPEVAALHPELFQNIVDAVTSLAPEAGPPSGSIGEAVGSILQRVIEIILQ